jgi:hypothetical protein
MTTQSGPSQRPHLQTQLAIALFGWQWRADWQAWCPPGWPSRTGSGYWRGERYQEQLLALKQHGGAPYGTSGALRRLGAPPPPAGPGAPPTPHPRHAGRGGRSGGGPLMAEEAASTMGVMTCAQAAGARLWR